ncbi:hypothetical protein ACOJUR_15695 [Alicyclobacillus tolerans]|uniref:hypothetical protein n=1 Tax=Alicyclobacillus tolerans TaxID=90970 RepID=UPI003B819091
MEEQITYIDRVKHVTSEHRTVNEALSFAQTIEEKAEQIRILTANEHTEVTVYTEAAIYHFDQFRADYVGHASKALLSLLEHFGVYLPMTYLTAHQSMDIYLQGNKIVTAEEKEYPIARRGGLYELVEPVQWMISSEVLDTIYQLAQTYDLSPVELVESAVGTLVRLHELSALHQITLDEIFLAFSKMGTPSPVEVTS